MKFNVHHFFGLTALSSAVILFSSGNIIATSSADVSSRTLTDSSSIGCVTEYIADGYCDQFNNNENCGGKLVGFCNESIPQHHTDTWNGIPSPLPPICYWPLRVGEAHACGGESYRAWPLPFHLVALLMELITYFVDVRSPNALCSSIPIARTLDPSVISKGYWS